MTDVDAVICGYCGQDIEDRQACVQAICSREECGTSLYHSWCVDAYTQRCIKTKQMKAGSHHKPKMNFKVKPWKNLELCSKCPAGWYKQNQSLKAMTQQELSVAQRSGLHKIKSLCPGHVISAESVDSDIKPKKGKHRTVKQQPPKALPAPTHSTKPTSSSTSAATTAHLSTTHPSTAPVQATMSLARAKEFLGLSSDDEDQTNVQLRNSPSIKSNEETIPTGMVDASHAGEQGTSTTRSTSPSPSLYSHTDSREVWEGGGPSAIVLSPGEVEVAIRDGLLPSTYRTTFCDSVKPGSPACTFGAFCPGAHTLEEFRMDPAIKLGIIKPDFKTLLCDKVTKGRQCSAGPIACHYAHTPQDLRIPEAVKLGWISPRYKTMMCAAWASLGQCPMGSLCPNAHGPEELRREAAVYQGIVTDDYKLELCQYYYAGFCAVGVACGCAHSVKDLRLGALRSMGAIDTGYKSALCPLWQQGKCPSGAWCRLAHGDKELLPAVNVACTLCPILKETGECHEDCLFAHTIEDLQPSKERMKAIKHFSEAFHEAGKGFKGRGTAPITTSTANVSLATSTMSSTNVSKASSLIDDGSSSLINSINLKKAASQHTFDYQKYKEAAAAKAGKTGGRNSGKSKQGEGGSRGPPGLNFAGRRRPTELRLCGNFRDMGWCPIVNCEYAHGPAEQRAREAAWMKKEREAEAQRRAAALEERRATLEAQEEERKAQAEMLRTYGFDISSTTAASGAGGQGIVSKDPRVEEAWSSISQAVLSLLRTHKEDRCVHTLLEFGFDDSTARAAAIVAGADVELAVSQAIEADGDARRLSMIAPRAVDITKELEDLLIFAFDHGMGADDVDVELSISGGDWDRAKQELSFRHLARGLPDDDLLTAEEENISHHLEEERIATAGQEEYLAEHQQQKQHQYGAYQHDIWAPVEDLSNGKFAKGGFGADFLLPTEFVLPAVPPQIEISSVDVISLPPEPAAPPPPLDLPESGLNLEDIIDSSTSEARHLNPPGEVGISEVMPPPSLLQGALGFPLEESKEQIASFGAIEAVAENSVLTNASISELQEHQQERGEWLEANSGAFPCADVRKGAVAEANGGGAEEDTEDLATLLGLLGVGG